MMSWLSQFRLSNALDSRGPLSRELQEGVEPSDELSAFHQDATALARKLKQTAPGKEPPPGLHSEIMRAVRASGKGRMRGSPRLDASAWMARWWGVPASAALLVLLLWWIPQLERQGQTTAPALHTAAEILDLSDGLTQAAPVTALAPLSEELDRLNRDLGNAAETFLASVP